MKRKNTDLLLKSLNKLCESTKMPFDENSYPQEFGDFVWCLSVARQDELDEVYKFAVEDERFWNLNVEIHAIFGRVYAGSLAPVNQKKAVEVSRAMLLRYCDPIEWEDVKNGLCLPMSDTK